MSSTDIAVSEEAAGISAVATLMAHPSRAAILAALVGGVALPAGQLAAVAGVTASTASEHLARLVAGGLLAVVSMGRHRYFRLTNPAVAQAIEAVAAAAPAPQITLRSPRGLSDEMRFARSCYDHLAGVLGVGTCDALVRQGVLVPGDTAFTLTPAGESRLEALGVDVAAARKRTRQFSPTCVDWTERRFHLAGALGAVILDRCVEAQWVARRADGRSLRVTLAGRRVLQREFGLDL